MKSRKQPSRAALNAVDSGISTANNNSAGNFDGLFGSLPENASFMLGDIVSYLRAYLLSHLDPDQTLTRTSIRAALRQSQHEGVKVAVGILNSVVSGLRMRDGQLGRDGKRLTQEEAVSLLFAGRDSVKLKQYLERQRSAATKGGKARSSDRLRREMDWKTIGEPLRQQHQQWSNSRLAKAIAKGVNTPRSLNTIRQAIPKLGLQKITDK